MKKITIPRTLSINWLHEMYMKKEITPRDVMEELIHRAHDDAYMNIWITPPSMQMIEPFLQHLETLDPVHTPLWGIPFAIKDNIDLAGVPTTAGCPEFAYTPSQHATVVERLLLAGAIPVGKTNLDQFATGLVGTRSPYGETQNALQKELISGGSSSGSAVSVACGHAAFSLGTDTAGSGRVPAALNGLVGYKSSLGAWSTKGVVPACASLDCVTVFAHSLEDALEVDHVVRGVDDANPWSKPLPQPMPALPQKICLPKQPVTFFGPYADEYRNAWNIAIERLKQLNIPLEYIDYELFSDAAAILYDGPLVAERWADLGEFINTHPSATFPVTEQVLLSGASEAYTAASVFQAMHKLQDYKQKTKQLLQNAVLITPTCGGTWTRDQVRFDPIKTNSAMGLYTNHCNLLDLCAVAVPAGEAASHMPFGITLFALSENEGLICGAASSFINDSTDVLETSSNNDTTLLAVCGLHMRGFSLEKQMHEYGAQFLREASTAATYQLIKLPTNPAKPGLIKKKHEGKSVNLEIWEMPSATFGAFVASIPSPLGIGKVELEDGSIIPGFICEAYAAEEAEDITYAGGWRNHI